MAAGNQKASRKTALACCIAGAGVATLVVVIAAAGIWQAVPATPESETADRLAGERWYAVTFRHTPIGHYRTHSGRTEDGDFEFRSVLRFKLEAGGETRVEDRLVFNRRPPHRLVRAEHAAGTAGSESRHVTITDGQADVVDAHNTRRVDVESDLELRDYVAIESWLADVVPELGDMQTARSIDFDALTVATDRWRVVATEGGAVEVVKESAPLAARIRIGSDLTPERMDSGGLIKMQRVDERAARVWERSPPLFTSADHRVPVDGVIENPNALRRLTVEVDHEFGAAVRWPNSKGADRLVAEADARRVAHADEITGASAATVNFPAADPEIRTLAQRAVSGLEDSTEMADSLAMFVHSHLSYRDTAGGRTVLDTVRDRSGDCTEFADLYTTLARAVGLPSRTVIGLAYQSQVKAFALHAWNEVAIDGHWRGLDPTWGQTRLGATHFALPTDDALAVIADLPHLSFRVVETQY